jgi:hypothetical protein
VLRECERSIPVLLLVSLVLEYQFLFSDRPEWVLWNGSRCVTLSFQRNDQKFN